MYIIIKVHVQGVRRGPRTIYKKVTNQSLRIMSPKSCRPFPFLNNANQHYIVPALKRCVELLVNVCRSLVTYLYITRVLPQSREINVNDETYFGVFKFP